MSQLMMMGAGNHAAAGGGAGTAFEATLTGSEAGFHNYTVGDKISSANLASVSGTTARVTISLALIVNDETVTAYIGQQASSGDAYDANALVQLTGGDFGGGTYTHASGTGAVVLVSDYTTLNEAFDSTKDYLVWCRFSGTGGVCSTRLFSSTGNISYYTTTDNAGTADKPSSGVVSTADTLRVVQKIEIA